MRSIPWHLPALFFLTYKYSRLSSRSLNSLPFYYSLSAFSLNLVLQPTELTWIVCLLISNKWIIASRKRHAVFLRFPFVMIPQRILFLPIPYSAFCQCTPNCTDKKSDCVISVKYYYWLLLSLFLHFLSAYNFDDRSKIPTSFSAESLVYFTLCYYPTISVLFQISSKMQFSHYNLQKSRTSYHPHVFIFSFILLPMNGIFVIHFV